MPRLKSILVLAIVTMVAVSAGMLMAQDAKAQASPVGAATISDDQASSDALTYTLTNVPAPSAGAEYVGWLISDDDSVKLSTGAMERGDDGSITHVFDSSNPRYTGANLIQGYDKVVITEEAAGSDPDEPTGAAAFSRQLPMGTASSIRALVGEDGSAGHLRTQLTAALDSAKLAQVQDTLENARQHLEAVVEAIDGPSGVLIHAQNAKQAAVAAAQATSDRTVNRYAASVEMSATNAESSAELARDEARIASMESQLQNAKLAIAGVVGFLDVALNGTDADANGSIESASGEGGAAHAYMDGQLMATYSLQEGGIPTPTPTPAPPTPTPVPPTPTPVPTPTPEPTPTAVPPSPGDSSVPGVMQIALVASVLLLVAGGVAALGGRRREEA